MTTTPLQAPDYISVLAHELKTPISSVKSIIDLIPHLGPTTPKQDEFIEKAIASLDKMSLLIDEVLVMSRAEHLETLTTEPCNLRLLVGEAANLVEGVAAQRNVTVEVAIPPDLPLAAGESSMLRQVFNNLLSNAVKYNQAGGTVRVTASADATHVTIAVSDTGLGIPAADVPHIFEPFYRAKTDSIKKIEGSGLGLSIVATIIQRHNGGITVASTPNVGTTFTVRLPLA
ncbi:MAG: sensor histidine kinase [Phototrophicaceae bacterium]